MTGALVLGLVIGAVLGAVMTLALAARRSSSAGAERSAVEARLAASQEAGETLSTELGQARAELVTARAESARLMTETAVLRSTIDERELRRDEDERRLAGTFRELSQQVLLDNNEQFLLLAGERLTKTQMAADGDLARRQAAIEQLLEPFRDTLSRYQESLRQLELDRKEAYAQLTTQVGALGTTQEQLQRETRNLVVALRSPHTRGRWGELQLRRAVELAGMVQHCDFSEQVTVQAEDGRLRPDMVVHLPGGAQVVVDSKVALDAYLTAVEADDDATRATMLAAHARQLRTHVDQLAKKEYWAQFDASPELVVAFVPGDPLLAAACEQDPGLVEYALARHVHLVTPTTLIALLRAIAYSWRQEDMAANAREVQEMGAELYDRLRVMGGHLTRLHKHLTGTVTAFNETVGSLESRVLVTARRFPEMGVGVGDKELPEIEPVTAAPRLVQAPELAAAPAEVVEPDAERSDGVIRRLTGS